METRDSQMANNVLASWRNFSKRRLGIKPNTEGRPPAKSGPARQRRSAVRKVSHFRPTLTPPSFDRRYGLNDASASPEKTNMRRYK
jgi:hypothetical protein